MIRLLWKMLNQFLPTQAVVIMVMRTAVITATAAMLADSPVYVSGIVSASRALNQRILRRAIEGIISTLQMRKQAHKVSGSHEVIQLERA